jgi:signal transduction histidine kinase
VNNQSPGSVEPKPARERSTQSTILSSLAYSDLKRRTLELALGWQAKLARLLFPKARLHFVVLVPAIVLVFGLAASLSITWIGVEQLGQQSDSAAALRAKLLAKTLAERVAETGVSERSALIDRAATHSGAELLLVDARGGILVDGSVKAPPAPGVRQLLIVGEGETQTALGRVRFFAAGLPAPEDGLSVVTFVSAPRRSLATDSLVGLVAAFTAVLLGVAALVAYALARDVHADVAYVKDRIVQMARPDAASIGEVVPVRTVDQVGAMTHAFNELVERFREAKEAYEDDLKMAMSMERDRSAFLAALSHELKTPLNVILGFADVLLAEVEGPLSDEARENLEVVSMSGAHLKALIKDILDLSALESGELSLARSLHDVYPIAADVIREHRVTALQKGLYLTLSGESAEVWADPVRVHQMLGNLVGNALKFTREGGVSVQISQRGEQTAIVVTDSGPGIAAKEQAAIFEDFAQVGDPRARVAGTGLGLAITRRLVNMHGGQIRIRSELGHGAEFTVFLPAVVQGQSHSRAKLNPSLAPPSSKRGKE